MRSSLRRLGFALLLSGSLAMSCGSAHPATDGVPVQTSYTHFASWPEPRLDVAAPADNAPPTSPYTRAAQQPATVIRWPEKFWAKNYRATALWSGPDATATPQVMLPEWSLLEFMGQQRSGRLLMHYPGDGRNSP